MKKNNENVKMDTKEVEESARAIEVRLINGFIPELDDRALHFLRMVAQNLVIKK